MNNTSCEVFDYIIVGAGSAGALLASRLAEQEGIRICLLEAGPSDNKLSVQIPAGFMKAIFDPNITWGFNTESNRYINNRSIPAIQGKVVGGSSSINGMVYVRGQREDYNRWAKIGNIDWSYDEVLPYFNRTESLLTEGDHALRGLFGKMPVTHLTWKNKLLDAFVETCVENGSQFNKDYNGLSQEGTSLYQYNIGKGRRRGSAQAYLKPALKTGAIDLKRKSIVTEIVFDEENRASAVRYISDQGSTTSTISARREIILCCGAINTPRLMQISGIGDPNHLEKIGVPVVKSLPGVGANLKDHYTSRFTVQVKGAVSINDIANSPRVLMEGAKWLLKKPSIVGMGVVLGASFCKSDPLIASPDMVITFTPGSFKEGFLGRLDDIPGMTIGTWQLRPNSVGHVKANSKNIFDPPTIQPNYFQDERDRKVLVSGLKMIRQLLKTPPLCNYVEQELTPGSSIQSDADFLEYARNQGLAGYHYCGTCRMGDPKDESSVVDGALRVHGIEGLRIVDASVMPSIISGNTNAATMMIAERGAEFILKDRHLS